MTDPLTIYLTAGLAFAAALLSRPMALDALAVLVCAVLDESDAPEGPDVLPLAMAIVVFSLVLTWPVALAVMVGGHPPEGT